MCRQLTMVVESLPVKQHKDHLDETAEACTPAPECPPTPTPTHTSPVKDGAALKAWVVFGSKLGFSQIRSQEIARQFVWADLINLAAWLPW